MNRIISKHIITNTFQKRFGQKSVLISAPGRFNLIGEHTDYNLGWVMPGALDKCIHIAISEQPDKSGSVNVFAYNLNQVLEDDVSTAHVQKEISWQNYIRAIIDVLKKKNYFSAGFRAVFGGDIPIGAGLSSSAALCCGFITALLRISGLDPDKKEIAQLAQAAEHRIGLQCGLMDQYAVMFGRENSVLKLDCKTLEYEYLPLSLNHYKLVLIDSMVSHQLAADTAYNDRRKACQRVVNHIKNEGKNITSLRDISLKNLEEYSDGIASGDLKKARFVLKENERVLRSTDVLKEGNLPALGALLNESHEGLKNEYEVTIAETDLLQALANDQDTIVGARQVGGGFGGCILVLLERIDHQNTIETIKVNYYKETGRSPNIYEVVPSKGVHFN